ncbi:hypothetical protein IPL68_03730 [Candidatus Saccharibacteria bacterium]|nr:MAG: hypothetical protein IPL68_03730 [Candidatus Saccharibacteria bacterium]
MKTIEQAHRRDTTAHIIDELIRIGSFGALVSAGLLAPGVLIGLRKPFGALYSKLDEREREREIRRIIYYMKSRGYLAGDYEHGLQITEKARRRLTRVRLSDVIIRPQEVWDKTWRVIIYDIPEEHAAARRNLTRQLRHMGCFQLQRSTWITPFLAEMKSKQSARSTRLTPSLPILKHNTSTIPAAS